MPFLTLNGTTVRIRSNAATEKYNEHGLDRFRTFNGEMRMTRRGQYREWGCTSKHLTAEESFALIALLKSSSLPLLAAGDLIASEDSDECSVMPILISNDPVQTRDGWRRLVVFTLHETPTALPADTTALPYFFYRRGVGMFSDDSAVTPAGDGDYIHVWQDQSGNSRHATNDGGLFTNVHAIPVRDGDGAHFFLESGTSKSFNITSLSGLTDAELMISIKAAADPSGSDGVAQLYRLGSADTFYPKTTGHIVDGFGTGTSTPVDWGDPSDDLTEWNVFNPNASSTLGYEGRLNNVLKASVSSGSFSFGLSGASIGNVGGSGYFSGWIRDVVLFNGILTTSQRRSWYDYLSGTADDPPLPG